MCSTFSALFGLALRMSSLFFCAVTLESLKVVDCVTHNTITLGILVEITIYVCLNLEKCELLQA